MRVIIFANAINKLVAVQDISDQRLQILRHGSGKQEILKDEKIKVDKKLKYLTRILARQIIQHLQNGWSKTHIEQLISFVQNQSIQLRGQKAKKRNLNLNSNAPQKTVC